MSTALSKPVLITNESDDARLAGARMLAKLMDTAFEIPGTGIKVGLDPLLGLLPGIGDAISSAIGGYIVMVASQMGVPRAVIGRMMANLAIDMVIGVVPLVGDMLDVAWKANVKNVRLLEQALADPQAARRSSRWVLVGVAFAVILLGSAGAVLTWLLLRAVAGHT